MLHLSVASRILYGEAVFAPRAVDFLANEAGVYHRYHRLAARARLLKTSGWRTLRKRPRELTGAAAPPGSIGAPPVFGNIAVGGGFKQQATQKSETEDEAKADQALQ